MFVIVKLGTQQKYWTDQYEEKSGFLYFQSEAKTGKVSKHRLALKAVEEITEVEVERKEDIPLDD